LLMSGDKHESEKGLLKAVDKLQKWIVETQLLEGNH
jgi:hypothetical protein